MGCSYASSKRAEGRFRPRSPAVQDVPEGHRRRSLSLDHTSIAARCGSNRTCVGSPPARSTYAVHSSRAPASHRLKSNTTSLSRGTHRAECLARRSGLPFEGRIHRLWVVNAVGAMLGVDQLVDGHHLGSVVGERASERGLPAQTITEWSSTAGRPFTTKPPRVTRAPHPVRPATSPCITIERLSRRRKLGQECRARARPVAVRRLRRRWTSGTRSALAALGGRDDRGRVLGA